MLSRWITTTTASPFFHTLTGILNTSDWTKRQIQKKMGLQLMMPLFALFITGVRCWAPQRAVHINRLVRTYEKIPGQLVERYLEIKGAKRHQVGNKIKYWSVLIKELFKKT
jgi:hypothetical protein